MCVCLSLPIICLTPVTFGAQGKGFFCSQIRSVLVKFFHGVDNLAEATGVVPVMLISVSIRVGLVCIY